ncbi:MAG: hypothetical protein V4532_06020 [Pseudomonadota bacterium]
MKNSFFARVAALALIASAAGCASVAVSNDAIEQNTAFALGLPKGSFTISDRVDDGVKSTYVVKTNAGKQYSCYVTGSVAITGRVVSDAICQAQQGKSSAKPAAPARGSAASCNALLKAAGKCQ